MKKTRRENSKRMRGSIRLSKEEKEAFGLDISIIRSDAIPAQEAEIVSYKKPLGKSYRFY
jgi:hypothetical protein